MLIRPVLKTRSWRPETLYSKVDWTNLEIVVSEFRKRLAQWYLVPTESLSGHQSFPVIAMDCLLLDTLSQYEAGEPTGNGDLFKDFVRKYLPEFQKPVRGGIPHRNRLLDDCADVLYHGFRCGILHEAGLPPWAAIVEQDELVTVEESGLAEYEDGTACPVVIVDPFKLRNRLKNILDDYTTSLKDPAPENNSFRENFATKFSATFGIPVPNYLPGAAAPTT